MWKDGVRGGKEERGEGGRGNHIRGLVAVINGG